MQPVAGHPFVLAAVGPDGWGALVINCHCTACNDSWQHRCEYAPKAPVWVAQYAARHHHNVPGLRERFAQQYHLGLQQLRM